MAIEVAMNTPLAEALNVAIQPKLIETGWGTGGSDDQALTEYIILMLVNGKTQDQIAVELATDLLNLDPDDSGVKDFARWLFDELQNLNNQLSGGAVEQSFAQGPVDAMITEDADMGLTNDGTELNAPTGPKSMRNGNMRGGREKRMMGQMNRAMDRAPDNVLHRIRGAAGNERINSHRGPPTGPRGGRGMNNRGMNNRGMNNRAAGIARGMTAGMPGLPGAPGQFAMNDMSAMAGGMMVPDGNQEQIFQLLQQQNQMMAALQQQLAQQQQQMGHGGRGRSQNNRGNRRGGHHTNGHSHQNDSADGNAPKAEGDDIDMDQASREPPNPETTVCKFNLKCNNKDCKFAHQSSAAPPGVTVDVNDVCTYGAACKNFKCVGRHPSPAAKRAHQLEQDCKFYPNCTNPNCPFKHPDMPLCRNGGDCSVEGCKFTHLQTLCKYKPCTNRSCPYKHEDGQRGTFQDKVWTAEGGAGKEHVSDRKFVDGDAEEVMISGEQQTTAEVNAEMDAGIA